MAKQWISKAIKHKGALHKELGVKQGHKIPHGKIEAAANSKNPKLRKRAKFALELENFHKR